MDAARCRFACRGMSSWIHAPLEAEPGRGRQRSSKACPRGAEGFRDSHHCQRHSNPARAAPPKPAGAFQATAWTITETRNRLVNASLSHMAHSRFCPARCPEPLTAPGAAQACPSCLPSPANQLTFQDDPRLGRPFLPSSPSPKPRRRAERIGGVTSFDLSAESRNEFRDSLTTGPTIRVSLPSRSFSSVK